MGLHVRPIVESVILTKWRSVSWGTSTRLNREGAGSQKKEEHPTESTERREYRVKTHTAVMVQHMHNNSEPWYNRILSDMTTCLKLLSVARHSQIIICDLTDFFF